MNPVDALRVRGGASRREDLLGVGVSRWALDQALARGLVVRAYRGVYALPGASHDAVLTAMFRATPTCLTVLHREGIPLLNKVHSLHLAVPRDRARTATDRRPVGGVILHRTARTSLPGGPGEIVLALRCASRCLSFDEWAVAADGALYRGVLSLGDAVRCWRGDGRSGTAVRACLDEMSESPAETLARLAMTRAGLRVRSQVQIDGIGRVDFVVGEVVIEIDGREFHADPESFVRDRRRDRALRLRGFTVLRYAAAEVFADPSCVPRDVRRLQGSAGTRLGGGGL